MIAAQPMIGYSEYDSHGTRPKQASFRTIPVAAHDPTMTSIGMPQAGREHHETDRYVRAGDQHVDHRVVEALHDLAGTGRLGESVI